MHVVDINQTFEKDGTKYEAGHKYVMAEDIESKLRNAAGPSVGMAYNISMFYRPYKGEDLTGKRLFFWRTGGIGDLHWLSPVARYLKRKYPTCYLRVASACKQPLENLPEIDDLQNMPFDAKLLEDCDWHLFFQGIIEGNSAEAKKTHAVDMFFSYFKIDSTQFPPEDKVPKIVITEKEQRWLSEEMIKLGVGINDLTVGIQVETSSVIRNYPNMKGIVDVLAKEDVKIFLVGSKQQEPQAQFLKTTYPNVILATGYDVRQSIVLASRYNLIVAPDSWLIQTAGALDKPTTGIYGPFPSGIRMKYFAKGIGIDSKVVCSPCCKHDFQPCIKGTPSPCFSTIPPGLILEALDWQRNKYYGGHFKYMDPLLAAPDFSEIDQYFLTADKGLCFFGGYYKHHNMLQVGANKFAGFDLPLEHPFPRGTFPFVLYMFNAESPVYQDCKALVRPGGHFILHIMTPETGLEFWKKDIAKDFVLMYSKYDPIKGLFTLVGRKS